MALKSTFLSTLLLSCALCFVAHADLTYTTVTKSTFSSEGVNESPVTTQETDTDFVTLDRSREDRELRLDGTVQSKLTIITRCDLHQEFHVNNNLKIYSVKKLHSGAVVKKNSFSSPASGNSKDALPAGKEITHISIQKLASGKVNGINSDCYVVTWHTQDSGCIGNKEFNSKTKYWIAKLKNYHTCDSTEIQFHEQIPTDGKCRIAYETVGDVEEYKKLFSPPMLIMRSESVDDSDNSRFTQKITSLSQAKLNDSLFEIPASYRKVSEKEFEDLEFEEEEKSLQKSK